MTDKQVRKLWATINTPETFADWCFPIHTTKDERRAFFKAIGWNEGYVYCCENRNYALQAGFKCVQLAVERVKDKKRQYVREVSRQGYGFILWNPDEDTAIKAGRPGYGSFEWYGLSVARRAALDALTQPGITQVSIRTNQDRQIARLYRHKFADYIGQTLLPFDNSRRAISKAFQDVQEVSE